MMKKRIEQFKKLSLNRKVQLIAASVITCALIVAIPVVAWFGQKREIIKLQKVKSPNVLFLSAAHREDSVNFEVKGIDADEILVDGYGDPILDNNQNEQKITHKDYVFSVTGDAVDKFTIQLAYTTNNPFEYEIYAAEEVTASEVVRQAGTEFQYVEYKLTDMGVTGMPVVSGGDYHLNVHSPSSLFYKIDSTETDSGKAVNGKYTGQYLNLTQESSGSHQDGKSNDAYHGITYDSYSYVHHDVEPVYWQVTGVSAMPGEVNSNKQAFSRHFILRVKWNSGDLDNTTKETDIVYISVKATS